MSTKPFDRLIVVEGRSAAKFAGNLRACFEREGTAVRAIDMIYTSDSGAGIEEAKEVMIVATCGAGEDEDTAKFRHAIVRRAPILVSSTGSKRGVIFKHPDPRLRGSLVKLARKKVPSELRILER